MSNKLAKTMEKSEINTTEVQDIATMIFGGDAQTALPFGSVGPQAKRMQEEMKRPRFEITNDDYVKLKIICARTNEDIGKMLYMVFKTWLDSVKVEY